ncbi:recombinase family protein [Defluviimonas sp. WL0024]|uniref:Recombinase family protein n=1 Tax=Albidovulum salinarum TaxID=2984153 RepID=A0ABT2XCV5_9RHOB|nr:recombinase family protein [Defluviimonas sp. WL0024]MCU9849535.1 recombinase family protein [Defluviimonas sp. WL0024]
MRKIRCAIYTRKSSEDGLEQEFNSLHAQREACAAYIASQKAEGWVLLPTCYDDGGISGGTLERPAMRQLLADVDAGPVDQIVVYKIDRLTRSLADFAKIVERLDAAGASFVSVTQSFNTATSMGRLTLNMLLSFAQFEREVTAERIRDKIAASKRKGLWMGGHVPLGYDADGRTLKINATEAKTVRTIYDLYGSLGTVRAVTEEAARQGLRSKSRAIADDRMQGGIPLGRGHIHHILTNPLYAGRIRHKGQVHDGQHPAIIDADLWAAVQAQLTAEARKPRARKAVGTRSRLCGRLFDETGDRLTPSHSRTGRGTRLRYYISHRLVARSGEAGVTGWRLPAEELEARVEAIVRELLSDVSLAGRLTVDPGADEIERLRRALDGVTGGAGRAELLDMVKRVDIAPGALTLSLDAPALAQELDVDPARLVDDGLTKSVPFQLRKRGVETKLVLAGAPASRDDTLIRNIARAHHWYGQIRAGRSFEEIAADDNVSKRRVQQMIDLAFLAPEIVRDVLDGKQPLGFTSDWCKTHVLPSDWSDQRRVISAL